ncbi:hypothetical protein ABZ412_29350 [Nocardia sp. NPDC005746]|uniref:hypothetical protein n=1 Tax=Nocardia sp. NPDC005746 TaxID=3157062 RepID=UPI0033FA9149
MAIPQQSTSHTSHDPTGISAANQSAAKTSNDGSSIDKALDLPIEFVATVADTTAHGPRPTSPRSWTR